MNYRRPARYFSFLRGRVSIFIFLLPILGNTHALSWSSSASAIISAEFTDNLFLTADNPEFDRLFYSDLDASLTGDDMQSRIELTGGVLTQRFQNNGDANNEFYNSSIRYQYSIPNRDIFVLAQYGETSTRTTDLETIGIVNNFIYGKRRTHSIMPAFSLETSSYNTFRGEITVEQVAYDLQNYTDYRNSTITLAWEHILNETQYLEIELQGQRYNSTDNLIDYDYGTTTFSIIGQASTDWEYRLGAGAGYVTRPTQNPFTTFILRAFATRHLEYTRLHAMTETRIVPTSAAQLTRLSSIDLGLETRLTEVGRLVASTRATRSEIIDVPGGYINDSFQFDIAYRHRFWTHISGETRYRFFSVQSSADSRPRQSNSLLVAVTISFDEP